jgi:predicted nucleotidyltransferase
MDLFPDFRDLLAAFDESGVRFVVIGGYAVIFHGRPRATTDLDLLVSIDPENRSRLGDAVQTTLDGVPVRIMAIDDLLANKRASCRPRDLEDCRELDRVRAKKR